MTDPIKEVRDRHRERNNQKIEPCLFENGLVKGLIGIDDRNLTIYEWRCFEEKKGHTSKVLKSLKKEYQKIIVDGIGGYPEDESWKYWLHMRSKGLVDVLLDSYGNVQ